MMPAAVSTCGAKTTPGRCARIAATTSAIGGGANADDARLQHGLLRRNLPHLQNLRPAVAEPAVADDERLATGRELARHGLHAEAAAAGDDDRRACAVDLLQQAGNVAHHALELLRHVVQRAVGEDDRVLEQTVGIDRWQQTGHGDSLRGRDVRTGPIIGDGAATGRPPVPRRRTGTCASAGLSRRSDATAEVHNLRVATAAAGPPALRRQPGEST
jgi:hypothetical protein